jgi:[protein-PII] uridylyltransferase
MSRVAFKRDLDDLKTIEDFTGLVQSLERLKLLLVLTCADIMAVGPGIWNNWKAGLLRDLYYRTEDFLDGGMRAEPQDRRVRKRKDELRAALSEDMPADRVEAHLALGYPGYWLTFDIETHVRHARMIFAAEDSGAAPDDDIVTLNTQVDPGRGVTEVLVYAPDHPGLFSKIAGAIALAGGSILDAKIFTLTNSMALDTFTVQAAEGGVFDTTARLERLKDTVLKAVRGTIDLRAELARKSRTLPARAKAFPVPPRVIIHAEASKTHTVVEVNGRDRPGFLFAVTDALTGLSLQIASARVNTYGERVVDVFYVKDVFGMKVTHPGKLRQLKRVLTLAAGLQALESERGAAVARDAGRARRKADRAGRAAE